MGPALYKIWTGHPPLLGKNKLYYNFSVSESLFEEKPSQNDSIVIIIQFSPHILEIYCFKVLILSQDIKPLETN